MSPIWHLSDMPSQPDDVRSPGDSVAKLVSALGRAWLLSFGGCFWYGGIGGFCLLVDVQHATARGGGAREISLASRLRFCAVAVSSTSSLTPLKPRSRSRSSLRMRFIWANRISTFLRSRRDCWKASVLASARTRSRTSSLRSRVILRTTAVVHLGFKAQPEQSFLLAL